MYQSTYTHIYIKHFGQKTITVIVVKIWESCADYFLGVQVCFKYGFSVLFKSALR